MNNEAITDRRLRSFNRVIIGIFILIVLGLVNAHFIVSIVNPNLKNEIAKIRNAEEKLSAHRGDILDVNDNVLATSVDQYWIVVDQKQIKPAFDEKGEQYKGFKSIDCLPDGSNNDRCHEIDGHPVGADGAVGLARILGKALDKNPVELGYLLSGNSNYQIVAKDVTPENERKIAKKNVGFTSEEESAKKWNDKRKVKEPGLHILDYFRPIPVVNRVYPNENIAGEEIGAAKTKLNDDGTIGLEAASGIELNMNKELSGKDGILKYERGSTGDRIPSGVTDEEKAVNGRNIRTTLDIDVQWKLQQLLDDTKRKWGAEYGYGVVENVKTGEILAIGEADEKKAGSDAAAISGSKAIGSEFEPGSTVKTLAAAALMQYGVANDVSEYTVVSPYMTKNGQKIEDAHEERPTTHYTLSGIIGQSWNTGITMAAEPLTNQQRYDFLKWFKLGEKTTLGFSNEAPGTIHPPNEMDGRMRHTILFGQGMTASALQMVNSYATIANKGVDPQPKLIREIQEENGKWQKYTPENIEEPRRAISEEVAQKTMGILEQSVNEGISNPGKIDGYRVAGKSGTAEISCQGELKCNLRNFISVFPADNPQFAVGMFFRGRAAHEVWGSVVAIPPVTEMNQFLIHKYVIPPSAPADWLPNQTW